MRKASIFYIVTYLYFYTCLSVKMKYSTNSINDNESQSEKILKKTRL